MIAAFRGWWDRLVWSQIREAREGRVRAEQRVVILERQLQTMRRRHEQDRRGYVTRIADLEQTLAALGVADLPEVEA